MMASVLFGAEALCARDFTGKVNMFLGTSGDHGQLTPAAGVPFGMVSVCPDTWTYFQSGYDWSVSRTQGISVTRMAGTGARGGGGQLRVFPAADSVELHILKNTEKAVPGYYETALSNGVKVRLSANVNVALEQYIFPADGTQRTLIFDTRSSFEQRKPCTSEYEITDNHTIKGWTRAATVAARGFVKYYFTLHSSAPFAVEEKGEGKLQISYPADVKETEIRIALSSVDSRGADDALEAVSSRSFESVRRAAHRLWNDKLSALRIKTSDKDTETLFYTSVYNLYHSPVRVGTPDGRYHGTDGHIYTADGFTPYGAWSLWDSFRTKFPLFNIIEASETESFCTSLLHLYRTGKKNWATRSEPAMTVRTEHSIITIYDAWLKGCRNIDFNIGYEGMKNEAADNLEKLKMADQKLETAYDIHILSAIASILGKEDESQRYKYLADSLFTSIWRETFMTVTEDFDLMRDNGLYQGSRAQYRFSSPQAFDQMISWVGRDTLCAQLEKFFETYHFNQGNEPDIHYPFVFNILGAPEKSQHWVRRYLTDDTMVHLYGGNFEFETPYVGRAFRNAVDGYAPEMDEDDGTMSAWYIFATLGFYPVQLGTDRYEVVSPLFDRAAVKVGGGKWFRIRTSGRKSADDPVKAILIDGKEIDSRHISHNDIMSGKTMTIKY